MKTETETRISFITNKIDGHHHGKHVTYYYLSLGLMKQNSSYPSIQKFHLQIGHV